MAMARAGGIWSTGTSQRTRRPPTVAATATAGVPSSRMPPSPQRAQPTDDQGTAVGGPDGRVTVRPSGPSASVTPVTTVAAPRVPASSMVAPMRTRPPGAPFEDGAVTASSYGRPVRPR